MENTEQVEQQVQEEVPEQQVEEEETQQEEQMEAEATEAVAEEETANGAEEEAAEATEAEAANGDAAGDAPKEVKEGDLIKASTDNELKLFVGGLAKGTEASHLNEYFSTFGTVVDTTIMKDYETGKPRGFGFVLFDDKEVVEKVLAATEHEVNGGKVEPKKCEKKEGKMFVGGIKSSTEDDVVRTYFEQFGEIETYERPKDKKTNKLKGFCFIAFKKDGIIKHCQKQTHEIDGQKVDVKENKQQNKGMSNRGRGGFMQGGFQQYGGYGYQQYGGYGDYYNQGYGYDQGYGYGNFQGYGNQGGYGGYQQQGGFQRGGFRGGKRGRGGFGKAQGGRGNHQNSYQPY